MKCKKCNNEYPSNYYFAAEDICNECFEKLDDNEREQILHLEKQYYFNSLDNRIGFGRRFGALIIDIMLVTIISSLVIYFSGFYQNFSNFLTQIQDIPPTNTSEIIQEYMSFIEVNKIHFILLFALNLVYFSLEIFVGASVGKLLLGLQIMSKNEEPASNLNLLLRFSLKNSNTILNLLFFSSLFFPFTFLNNIISIFMLIGLFFIFSSKKQTLYDIISSTAVYKKTEEY